MRISDWSSDVCSSDLTLLEIVAHDVDETFAEHRDAVPFRVLAGFTGRTVFPALRSGDAKACDLAIAFAQRANFGICAELDAEDNLVQRAPHNKASPSKGFCPFRLT